MRFLTEYRDPGLANSLLQRIRAQASRPWILMETCGGQTHTLIRQGLDELLLGTVELIHGPGCPVCVTPIHLIDKALHLAGDSSVILASFGDMLRVPGSKGDLLKARARGGDIRVVYSPLDALELARKNPDREVVFFGVGFETTAPANAMAVWRARELALENFTLLASHVTVPPAMEAILNAPDNRVQAFLAAGHVCTVMGWEEYVPLSQRYRVPIVVTGFEPVDLLVGILSAVIQLEEGRHEVKNQYGRAVRREGNLLAQEIIKEVFTVVDREWRGIGVLPLSGLGLREEFASFDAERRFSLAGIRGSEVAQCRAGEVLQGRIKPTECQEFGLRCTPEFPMGAPMVSSEGACAAYYRSGRRGQDPWLDPGTGSCEAETQPGVGT